MSDVLRHMHPDDERLFVAEDDYDALAARLARSDADLNSACKELTEVRDALLAAQARLAEAERDAAELRETLKEAIQELGEAKALHHWKAAARLPEVEARLARYEVALRDIAAFGLRNSGCGYSCARKAEAALADSAPAVHPLVVDGVRHAANCRLFAYWNGKDVPEKCSCGADQPSSASVEGEK